MAVLRGVAEFSGLKSEEFLEPKPGIPPGPKHLSEIELYIKANDVACIAYASIYPSKAADTLSRRTGVPAIELAQSVGEVKQASGYIALIDYNVKQVLSAMGGDSK
jgi:ABC-type Zn uptake system ZnuABC Zn-binding protein ZnuA